MPAPIPDLSRDQQCHHYQAPSGQRCGSPALKGEYYCYHHLVKTNYKKQHRVLIDPELTRMEIPPIEDRASIFVALAAVIHRLAENTIDTRRAGQMIYSLQVAMRALEPPPSQRFSVSQHQSAAAPLNESRHPERRRSQSAAVEGPRETTPATTASNNGRHSERAQRVEEPRETTPATTPTNNGRHSERAQRVEEPRETTPATTADTTPPPDPPAPTTIPVSKESLLYFLRSRHCASCNAELFPASELTERRNAGAPGDVIEEARPALPAPNNSWDCSPAEIPEDTSGTLPTLQAVAENRTSARLRRPSPTPKPRVPHPSQFHREGWDLSRKPHSPHPLAFANPKTSGAPSFAVSSRRVGPKPQATFTAPFGLRQPPNPAASFIAVPPPWG